MLREAGLEVGPGRVGDAVTALDRIDLSSRDDVYWALRQTLVSRHTDFETFDRAFATWFERAPSRPKGEAKPRGPQLALAPDATQGSEATPDGERAEPGWSSTERLHGTDFAKLSPDELARVRDAIGALGAARPSRATHRLRPDRRGDVLDVRQLVRASLATGGEPIVRPFRGRKRVQRRLVVLCDVSRSMEPYARALLLFAHAAVAAGRAEAFAFGTRLTRVTPDLLDRDADRAVSRAVGHVQDWGGGTRIGASLAEFNAQWGRRGITRGAVVVIVSDGWERDDFDLVAREMARLARTAYALIWVNPLKGDANYQPLAGGMRAALPHVDRFLSGQNLSDIEELAHVLAGIERRHAA